MTSTLGEQSLLPIDASGARGGADRRWLIVLAVFLLAGLAIAPWVCEERDMYNYWFPWARATGGHWPWRAYDVANCNYPPFMIYVLTCVAGILRLFHVESYGDLEVFLIKVPSLLTYAGGAFVCAYGLRRFTDSRKVALAYVLCLPVWFNAAVWGQCDAMLCLGMLGVIVALMNDRPGLAGACMGWALSVKLQPIVIAPVIAIYAFRRFGWLSVVRAMAAAIVVLGIMILPMVAAGRGHALKASYSGAVGFYPYLSIDAFNPWALVRLFNLYLRHLSEQDARIDSVRWIGPVTPKLIGLLSLAGLIAILSIGIYRRPTRYNLALSAGLSAYGFYMLPTEMHERYVIPAAALLAIVAATSVGWKIYLTVMIPAAINQIKSQTTQHLTYHQSESRTMVRVTGAVLLLVSVFNCFALVWILWRYYRDVYGSEDPRQDQFAGNNPEHLKLTADQRR